MPMVTHEQRGHVALVTMKSGENRFNPDFLKAFMGELDEIENNTDARVLVVRSAHEKIWSNGLDLDWLLPVVENKEKDKAKHFFYQLNDFFKRILLCPMPTIASMNGHVFAGGAIAACAFDYRFMRTDRGFFCFPEVDLGIPFLPGMLALLRNGLPGHAFHDLALSGRRLNADECLKADIVQKAAHGNDLLDVTLAFAETLKKRREVVLPIKQEMYKWIVRVFDEEDPPLIESGRLQV